MDVWKVIRNIYKGNKNATKLIVKTSHEGNNSNEDHQKIVLFPIFLELVERFQKIFSYKY